MIAHLIVPVFAVFGYYVQQRKPSALKDIKVPFGASGKIF